MKRIIPLFLIICLIFTSMLSLIGCTPDSGSEDITDDDNGGGNGNNPPPIDDGTSIITPDYKDYGRGTADLSELVYTRPNLRTLSENVLALSEKISSSELDLSETVSSLTSLFKKCEEAEMMLSLVRISAARDSSVEFWKEEEIYFSEYLIDLTLANRELLSACAKSVYKAALEEELFGYSLDQYLDYTVTDTLKELYRQEAEILSEYRHLSPDNVEITYGDSTGTLTEMLAELAEKYGEGSNKYLSNKAIYTALYNDAINAKRRAVFTELVKVRRQIADELGCSSYIEVAYKNLGCDYTEAQMNTLLQNAKSALGSLDVLAEKIEQALIGQSIPKQDYEVTVNDMYSVYSQMNPEFGDAFAYMLQHGLYDIKESADVRHTAGFAEYISANNSPVIFVTVRDNIYDYEKISFLFGSFLDGYVNYGFADFQGISELYSLTSELLCLTKLDKKLSASAFGYTKLLTVYNMLAELEASVRYSLYEHEVYKLEYYEITEERLEELARILGMELYEAEITLDGVISEKSITAPLTNEAYVTSALGAVRVLELEQAETGAGANIFAALLERNTDSYQELLEKVGLDSPFEKSAFSDFVSALEKFTSLSAGS